MFQKFSLTLSLVLTFCLTGSVVLAAQSKNKSLSQNAADNSVWQLINDNQLRSGSAERLIIPNAYQTFNLNQSALREVLQNAPVEFTAAARNSDVVLTIPQPDGSLARFRIIESSIMEPALAAKHPEIKTYAGQGIDDPTATTRFDLSPSGFRAVVFSRFGTSLIEPYAKGETANYISFFKRDLTDDNAFECSTRDDRESLIDYETLKLRLPEAPSVTNGTQLRVYRLALAATAEYVNVFRLTGDTDAQAKTRALAAMVTIMNRVNGVYERDFSVRMILVANEESIIYTDPNTDPYTNNNGSTMLGQNQTNLDTVIGSANYDIGHVFSTGGGGIAGLRVPCGASKARGVTGLPNPVGDAFAIDYVAHEMGHQFGGNHTFNGGVGSCAGGNRSAGAAYEPGSGVTIMAYAGICGNQDLARNSIDTFHVRSLEEIVAFVNNTTTGGLCPVTTATGNSVPTVASTNGTTFNIPRYTPFVLTAAGTDANSDTLTYDWQEYDLSSVATTVPNTDSDNLPRPLFRPYLPTTNGVQYYPSLQYILDNGNVPPATYNCGRATPCLTGELLPSIARTMNFQVIARDNRASAGAVNTAAVQVVVSAANSVPFQITSPNTNVGWRPGTTRTINWDVAGTTDAPISAANVRISLSTDGGQTFPTVLSASTPNDGSENITVPNANSTLARVKIEAVGNIFFDISNANFTISTAAVNSTPFDFDGDGRADVSLFRPSNATWYIQRLSGGFSSVQFGAATDRVVAGDYDGDGRTDVAVYRPATGTWYSLNSATGTFASTQFGQDGDIPLVGDYDGDGKADLTVYRPSATTFFRLNSSNNQFVSVVFGVSGDIPTGGDFDGDGRTDISLFRPSNGAWYRLSSGLSNQFTATQFGQDGDVPAEADFNGDGKTDLAVFRPSNRTWYTARGTGVPAQNFDSVQFGLSDDVPVPADYDGDGRADIAVFRSSNGNWFIRQTNGGFTGVQFGTAGDKPAPAAVIQ